MYSVCTSQLLISVYDVVSITKAYLCRNSDLFERSSVVFYTGYHGAANEEAYK